MSVRRGRRVRGLVNVQHVSGSDTDIRQGRVGADVDLSARQARGDAADAPYCGAGR